MFRFNKVIFWRLSPQQCKSLEQLLTAVAVHQKQTKLYAQERRRVCRDCPIDADGGTGTTDKLLNAISVQEEKIWTLVDQCQQAKIPKWRVSLIV